MPTLSTWKTHLSVLMYYMDIKTNVYNEIIDYL